LADCRHQIGARPRLDITILRDHAAHHHAAKVVEPRENGLLHGAADILPINIDSVRTGLVEFCTQIGRAMVDAGVKAEVAFDKTALVSPASDPDDACSLTFRELADDGADCP